jgi:hypothetical protein
MSRDTSPRTFANVLPRLSSQLAAHVSASCVASHFCSWSQYEWQNDAAEIALPSPSVVSALEQ